MKLTVGVVALLLATPSLALAQPEETPPPPEEAVEPVVRPVHYDYLRFGLGFRIGYIDDPAFDSFASNDVLAQLSLDATYAFYTKGKLALASGLAWDVGSRSSGSRGLATRLSVHRLTVPVEARWYFAPWVNGFAKVAPGVAAYGVHVEDPSSPKPLEQAPWVFAADLSAGATFRLAGTRDHDVRRPRLWLTTEVGYGVTASHSLRPSPGRDDGDVLGADEATRLGSLALNGAFWRTGLALSF